MYEQNIRKLAEGSAQFQKLFFKLHAFFSDTGALSDVESTMFIKILTAHFLSLQIVFRKNESKVT